MKSISQYLTHDIDFAQEEAKAINLAKSGYYSNRIIDKYQLNDEEILINACELISYQEDAKICESCQGLNRCSKNSRGLKMVLTKQGPMLELGYTYCHYYQQKKQASEHLTYLAYTNINDNHFNNRIKDLASNNFLIKDKPRILNKMVEVINDYPIKTYGLYVSGESGVGKTLILSSLITEFLDRKYQCAYVSFPDLLNELKAKMNDSSYYELMELLKNVPILVMDDLGIENITNWSRDDVLTRIIDARYDNGLLTFFGSSYDLNDLVRMYQIANRDFSEKGKVGRLVNRIGKLSEQIILRKQ